MKNEKQQGGLCPKSQKTNLNPLKFALEKVHSYGFTNNKLDGIYKLHICRQTLAKIEKGINPVGKEQHYLGALVRTLNDLRLEALHDEDEALAIQISNDLRDIMLVCMGIATDVELAEIEHEKRKQDILNEIRLLTK